MGLQQFERRLERLVEGVFARAFRSGLQPVELSTDPDLSPGMLMVAGEMVAGGGAAGLVLPDGRRVALGDGPVTIGRLPECQVVLADTNVSRRHAEVRRAADGGGGHLVVDLGSTNGTKVNGVGIRSHRLQHGDEIVVGSTRLRYEAQ